MIDLLKHPQLAKGDQILAVPTVVRKLPSPRAHHHWQPFRYRPFARWSGPAFWLPDRDEKPEEKNTRTKPKPVATKAPVTAVIHQYILRLFVAGATDRSHHAILRVRELCETLLKGRVKLEVIDIYQQPALARETQIVATPTLIINLAVPLRRFIGNLTRHRRPVQRAGHGRRQPDQPEGNIRKNLIKPTPTHHVRSIPFRIPFDPTGRRPVATAYPGSMDRA